MTVAWLADFHLEDNRGGAQQTNDVMIRHAEKRGHTVQFFKRKDYNRQDVLKFDVIILNNITHFDETELMRLASSNKCIRYEHDLWVARNMPWMYERIPTIFLSPMHMETAQEIAKVPFKKACCVPSPIDTDKFRYVDTDWRQGVLWAGLLTDNKGQHEFKQFIIDNPDRDFFIAGWGDQMPQFERFDNVEILGALTHEQLIEWYGNVEYFYHKPRDPEAFGRSVMEAWSCGCKLMINDKIGALSYDWDLNDRLATWKELRKAPDMFWDRVEKIAEDFNG